MTNHLQKITSAELRILMRDARLVENVDAMRRDITRAANYMPTVGFAALAIKRRPDLSIQAAFEALMSEVAELIAEMEALGALAVADLDKEEKRLAPVVAAAAHRGLSIVGDISNIDARINSSQRNDAEKRERLRKAGLTGAELERVSAATDNSALLAQRAALLAENEALQAFLSSRDEQDLPEGFAKKVLEAA